MRMFRVVDNEFNRAWYRDIIGKLYSVDNPPSYALIEEINLHYWEYSGPNKCDTCLSLFGPSDSKLAVYKLDSNHYIQGKSPIQFRYLCDFHALQVFNIYPNYWEFQENEEDI